MPVFIEGEPKRKSVCGLFCIVLNFFKKIKKNANVFLSNSDD